MKVQVAAREALEKVRRHIDGHLGPRGEQWIREGLPFAKADECPFCGQSTSGVELVEQFASYFSKEYEEQVVRLEQAKNSLERQFGERAIGEFERSCHSNENAVASWKDLADLTSALSVFDELLASWRKLRTVLEERLAQKLTNPARTLGDEEPTEAALRDYESSLARLEEANRQIAEANKIVANLKKDAAQADLDSLEREARRLRNVQIRQLPEVVKLCDQLFAQQAEKTQIAAEKKSAREELEKQAGDVLVRYESSINGFLRKFGATFTIVGTQPDFRGGKASSTWKIAINEVALDLGDSKTKPGKACFRTALSTGDRSALALAFFLAKLVTDPDIAQKIVVFDDPLSSLDHFRGTCTQQEIRSVAQRAKQVIVLSHDPQVLRALYDDDSTAKTLHVKREGNTNNLHEWNIEEHCRSNAQQAHFVLHRYLENGLATGQSLLSVAQQIRVVVEDTLRQRYPVEMQGKKMLGELIKVVESAAAGEGAGQFKPHLVELNAVNEFARRFHHASNDSPSDTELRSYAARALVLVHSA